MGGRRASLKDLTRRLSQGSMAGGGFPASATGMALLGGGSGAPSLAAQHIGQVRRAQRHPCPLPPTPPLALQADLHHDPRDHTLDSHMRQYASALRLVGSSAAGGGGGGTAAL